MIAWELVFKSIIILALLTAGVPWALGSLKIYYRKKMYYIDAGYQDLRERLREFVKTTPKRQREEIDKYMNEI